jgi:iron complex transport system substrate-binding protein
MAVRHVSLVGVVALVAAVLAFAVPPLAAQEGAGSIQVGVVVQGADGQPQTFCVNLSDDRQTGLDALQATGLPIAVESGTMGTTVCQIAQDGCTPPAEHCFCQCESGSACAYWSYFHLNQQGNWQYSPTGAAGYQLAQGGVDGWWWRDSARPDAAPLPAISFDQICQPQPAFPRTVEDGMGRQVTINAPPQRIASVTLGSDEILLSLVGPQRLIGVTYFARDPAISNIAGQLDDIPHTDLSGDPEYLISLNADLVVLAAYNNPAALDQLLKAQVPVFVLAEFNTLDDIRTNIRLLGHATGEEAKAEAMIQEMDARLAAVQAKVKGQKPVRVLYYEPGGVTYGPGSTVDEIIRLAGGVNVVGEAGLGAYPLVDAEFVLASDPDVILLGGWFSGQSESLAAFLNNPAFRTLHAVKDGHVYPINDAHLTNVSQYIVLGVEDVARALYPQVFGEGGSSGSSSN